MRHLVFVQAELMVQLHAMEPHYVRCIKPNEQNMPALFENLNVLHQLKCGGVMEAVRISCAGEARGQGQGKQKTVVLQNRHQIRVAKIHEVAFLHCSRCVNAVF